MSTIQNWQIEDAKVKALDDLRVELNILASREQTQAISGYVSLTTIGKLGKKIKETRRQINSYSQGGRKLNLFDKLVFRDIKRNVEVINIYYDYFHNPKNEMNFVSFFSNLMGNKSAYYDYLQMMNPDNYPHEELDRRNELSNIIFNNEVDNTMIFNPLSSNETLKEIKKSLMEKFSENKSFIESFYKYNGLDVSKVHVDISSTEDGRDFFENILRTIALNSEDFFCYKDKEGKIKIDDLCAKIALTHEYAHAIHFNLSQNMPNGLRTKSEDNLLYNQRILEEGISQSSELFMQDHIAEKQQALGLSNEEVERASLDNKCVLARLLPNLVWNLLQHRELEEELNPKIPKQFKKLTRVVFEEISGMKRLRKDPFFLDILPFFEFVDSSLVYIEGSRRIYPVVKKMKSQGYGTNTILPALFHGCWSDVKAQEKFIFDLYLPRLKSEN